MELSGAVDIFVNSKPLKPLWIQMLKFYGTDKILFGSDQVAFGSNEDSQKSHLDFYKDIFTPTELNQILIEHPKNF